MVYLDASLFLKLCLDDGGSLGKNICSLQDNQLRFLFVTILAAGQFQFENGRERLTSGSAVRGAAAGVLPDLPGILGDTLSFVFSVVNCDSEETTFMHGDLSGLT